MSTLEIVVALVLVTTQVENLREGGRGKEEGGRGREEERERERERERELRRMQSRCL